MSKAKLKSYLFKSVKKTYPGKLDIKTPDNIQYLITKTGIEKEEAELLLDLVNKRINKNDIDVRFTPIDIGIFIDIFIEAMIKTLIKDDKLTIPNFGNFKIKESKARVARNPRTGDPVQLPDRNVIRFKPAAKLKNLIK